MTTVYTSPENRTSLEVHHDAHGCVILRTNPSPSTVPAQPYEYGIPVDQLPAVLLDMAGGPETAEETELALEWLSTPDAAEKGMEDLLGEVRRGIIAMRIRHAAITAVQEAADEDLVDAEIHDDFDDMDHAMLLAEAKNLREAVFDAMRQLEAAREAAYEEKRRSSTLENGLLNIANAITNAIADAKGTDGGN